MSSTQSIQSFPERVKLSTLLSSLTDKNYARLEADLKSPEKCVLTDKSTNMNLIHIAALYGDLKAFEIIFKSLPRETIATLARSVPDDNDASVSDTDGVDPEADITPDAITLPTTNVRLRDDLSDSDKQTILKMLEALPLDGGMKPCHELIDEKEIERRYPDAKGELLEHLTAAVWAINSVRNLKIESYNHPEYIHKIKSAEALEKLRDTNGIVLSHSPYEDIASKTYADDVKISKTGNCEKWAHAAKDFLKAKGFKIYNSTHLFGFVNSDHIFLKIGDKNPVYCDPWSGTFCTEADFQKTICGSYFYWSDASQKTVGYRTLYNPNFHTICPVYKKFRKTIVKQQVLKRAADDHKSDSTQSPAKKMRMETESKETAAGNPIKPPSNVSDVSLFKKPGEPSQSGADVSGQQGYTIK